MKYELHFNAEVRFTLTPEEVLYLHNQIKNGDQSSQIKFGNWWYWQKLRFDSHYSKKPQVNREHFFRATYREIQMVLLRSIQVDVIYNKTPVGIKLWNNLLNLSQTMNKSENFVNYKTSPIDI